MDLNKIENLLNVLDNLQLKHRALKQIKDEVEFFSISDDLNIMHNENFDITYNIKENVFSLETTYSNQKITIEWLNKANTILKFINS